MPHVPGLRSPYAKVGRLVYFGRLLDKIRLHAAGKLPPDYHDNLGETHPGVFDARCCRFLGVSYEEIKRRVLAGETDEAVLAWAEQKGARQNSDDDCLMFNKFLMKRGWRDDPGAAQRLRQRVVEGGLTAHAIETFFDFIDFDEGRDPLAERPWEKD